ncbi:MAG: group II intron maturase-specific domain-containing protein [Bacteroidales bacterium]|nr:group II intron maturase-specific domain-containing protein [Bacteroidales bacterium]
MYIVSRGEESLIHRGHPDEVQRGWLNYFRMASIQGKLKGLDGWVRNRLRYCIWLSPSAMLAGQPTRLGGDWNYWIEIWRSLPKPCFIMR